MKKLTAAILVLGALGTLPSCSSVQKALNIENPTYRVRDLRPRVSVAIPFSASTIDFDFVVEVDNPNSVGLQLDRLDFDILVNGTHLIDGVSRDRIRVPANGTGEVRLRAKVGYENMRSLFREMVDVIQGERADYEVRGRAYYDTPLGQLDFPVTVYRTPRSRR